MKSNNWILQVTENWPLISFVYNSKKNAKYIFPQKINLEKKKAEIIYKYLFKNTQITPILMIYSILLTIICAFIASCYKAISFTSN